MCSCSWTMVGPGMLSSLYCSQAPAPSIESVGTEKMYGITTSGPKLEIELVSRDGVCVSIGKDVQDLEALSTVVARAANDSLRKSACRDIQQGRYVRFGAVAVSERGLLLKAPC